MLAAVVALEQGAGPANDAVAGGIGVPVTLPAGAAAVISVGVVPALERCGSDRCRGADGGACSRACRIDRPEAGLCLGVRSHLPVGHAPVTVAAVCGGIAGGDIL